MVKIRLSRSGAKKRPFFPIVVIDSRTARDGACVERLGFFNPIARGGEERLRLDMERLSLWIQRGAQVSERVGTLIKEAKAGPEASLAKRQAKAVQLKAAKAKKKAAITAVAEQASVAKDEALA